MLHRYIAMYNYRPQKDDEVELCKGDYYTVSEKCQDGWFKGQCLRTGVSGVFPGNYVQGVRWVIIMCCLVCTIHCVCVCVVSRKAL